MRPINLLLLPVALAGCADRAVVRVDGSAGVIPLVAGLARAYAETGTRDSLAMGGGLGSRARLDSLASGAIDIALASHGLDSGDLSARGLVAREIAQGAVVFGAHQSVPLPGLSEAQLCDIFAGRVENWRDLGGPDLPIVPHVRPASEVDAEVVLEQVACWRTLTPGARVITVKDPSAMVRAIADTPGAIGMTSSMLIRQGNLPVRELALDGVTPDPGSVAGGAWRLRRRFLLVTRAAPEPAIARFLEFAGSPAGVEVIRAAGAVPGR
jgi:phosphate transport system substrate-binding protein